MISLPKGGEFFVYFKPRVKGAIMDNKLMFKGFESEEEWKNAVEEQTNHLKKTITLILIPIPSM
jgi:hypothetical protein